MLVRELRTRPHSWSQYTSNRAKAWLWFHAIEWAFEWCAYYLSRWALLEVLEYLGILSVLLGVIFYFSEAGDRKKQKHYQAWQVINTAQGKGGSGGRIEALQELNMDHEPLVGVNAAGAFLQGIRLRGANLLRADLEASDLRNSDLAGCDLQFANLRWTNFEQANLRGAKLHGSDMTDADLTNADLRGADLGGANLDDADLRDSDLQGIQWQDIRSMTRANIHGVRHAPAGFEAWALQHQAVSTAAGDK